MAQYNLPYMERDDVLTHTPYHNAVLWWEVILPCHLGEEVLFVFKDSLLRFAITHRSKRGSVRTE